MNPSDSFLIIAPHPDDEILTCGGLIQQAIENGAKVHILYITNGSHNFISLLYYKIHYRKEVLIRTRGEFIELGRIRRRESIKACKHLGIGEESLTFLDYPDAGILKIFSRHWGEVPAYVDSLSRKSCVEINGQLNPLASYKGENILNDIKKVMLKIKPTKMFIPTSFDHHEDHIGTYLFCILALGELRGEVEPVKFFYLAHKHRRSFLDRFDVEWCQRFKNSYDDEYLHKSMYVNLSARQLEKKKRAIEEFKSQMYCRKFLYSFLQSRELFGVSLSPVNLKEKMKLFSEVINNRCRT